MINSLWPRQDGRRFADDLFKCIFIFLNENVRISIKISLKFIPKGPINNISALVQIMAWRRSGDKPLSEAMVFSLLTHICVTRPQWVNYMFLFEWLLIHVLNSMLDRPVSFSNIRSGKRTKMIVYLQAHVRYSNNLQKRTWLKKWTRTCKPYWLKPWLVSSVPSIK